jgi:hypothetical protein
MEMKTAREHCVRYVAEHIYRHADMDPVTHPRGKPRDMIDWEQAERIVDEQPMLVEDLARQLSDEHTYQQVRLFFSCRIWGVAQRGIMSLPRPPYKRVTCSSDLL